MGFQKYQSVEKTEVLPPEQQVQLNNMVKEARVNSAVELEDELLTKLRTPIESEEV